MTSTASPPTRPLEPQRRAIVIGASSGIGAALVRELAHSGYSVAAVARREALLQQLSDSLNTAAVAGCVLPFSHSVTDFDDIPGLFQKIVQALGGLDLIVYAAGVQPSVTLGEYSFEKDRKMIDVNLLGAIAWLNQAALRFERAGQGSIVGIGSIAGDRGRIGSPVYNTSKAGLATYLESLRNRLTRQGVSVITVKPGYVDTSMLENVAKPFWVISPQQAAAQIHTAVRRRRQTVYVPARWRLVGLIIQHVPSVIFRRLSF